MNSFSFKKEVNISLTNKVYAHSTMNETMKIVGDFIEIAYFTKFEGNDLNTLNH